MMAALDEARFPAVHFGGYVTLIERRGNRESGRRELPQPESDEGIAASLREYTVFEDGTEPSEILPASESESGYITSRLASGRA